MEPWKYNKIGNKLVGIQLSEQSFPSYFEWRFFVIDWLQWKTNEEKDQHNEHEQDDQERVSFQSNQIIEKEKHGNIERNDHQTCEKND